MGAENSYFDDFRVRHKSQVMRLEIRLKVTACTIQKGEKKAI